jgi:hypothetical protein
MKDKYMSQRLNIEFATGLMKLSKEASTMADSSKSDIVKISYTIQALTYNSIAALSLDCIEKEENYETI